MAGPLVRDRSILVGQLFLELDRIDRDLERLLAVDLDDGDPDPVLELELLVGLDVHLVEREPQPRL